MLKMNPPHHSTGPGKVFQWATASAIAAAMATTPGYRAALYRGTAPAGGEVALVLGAEAVAAALGAAALVEATALGVAASRAVVLGVVALVVAAREAVVFGAVEFIVYPCLSGIEGRWRARANGCHFHKFPSGQQQAILTM